MGRYKPEPWGDVNLGVDVLQGHGEQNQPGKSDFDRNHPGPQNKQQFNPGRNQELNLPPDIFRMHKYNNQNSNSPTGKINFAGVHERIKELLGEGVPRREALIRAKQEAEAYATGQSGKINKNKVYQSKYQAEEPWKKISPFSSQVQGYPYI